MQMRQQATTRINFGPRVNIKTAVDQTLAADELLDSVIYNKYWKAGETVLRRN